MYVFQKYSDRVNRLVSTRMSLMPHNISYWLSHRCIAWRWSRQKTMHTRHGWLFRGGVAMPLQTRHSSRMPPTIGEMKRQWLSAQGSTSPAESMSQGYSLILCKRWSLRFLDTNNTNESYLQYYTNTLFTPNTRSPLFAADFRGVKMRTCAHAPAPSRTP